jgi:hypothetical protein
MELPVIHLVSSTVMHSELIDWAMRVERQVIVIHLQIDLEGTVEME